MLCACDASASGALEAALRRGLIPLPEPRLPQVEMDGDTATLHIIGVLTKYCTALSESTHALRQAIERLAADDGVARIHLVVHSGGGELAGTSDLADAVFEARQRKPVVAYLEDMCASGALWIASQATRIVASPFARVGGIGVFMIAHDESEGYRRDGVKTRVIRTGAMKGAGAPGAEITDAQIAEWQRQCDEVHELFVGAISRARPAAQVAKAANGALFSAKDALRLGLIDAIASIDDAFGEATDGFRVTVGGASVVASGAVQDTARSAGRKAAVTMNMREQTARERVEAQAARIVAETGCARNEAVRRVLDADETLRLAWIREVNGHG